MEEEKRNNSEGNDGEILIGVFLTWFIGGPLILALAMAGLGFFLWLIDLLPGPGWLAAMIILIICILYGWWSASRD